MGVEAISGDDVSEWKMKMQEANARAAQAEATQARAFTTITHPVQWPCIDHGPQTCDDTCMCSYIYYIKHRHGTPMLNVCLKLIIRIAVYAAHVQ